MAKITTATTAASYTASSGTAALAGALDAFTHEEWAALGVAGGLIIGLLTWLTNFYFQYRRTKILEAKALKADDAD